MQRLFLIFLTFVLLSSCSSNKVNKDNLVRPVKIGFVFKSLEEPVDVLSGNVVAAYEATPSFSVPGLLQKIYVKEGDFVRTGQLIASIESADYQSNFDAAQSKYTQVKSEVSRVEELYRRSSVTKNDYEKAVSGEQTIASLYETTKHQLKNTKLYSPIIGVVQKINAGLYQTIMPGMGVLTIVNTSSLNVEANISSSLFVQRNNFKEFVGYSPLVADSIPLKLIFVSPKANNNQLYKILLEIEPKYQKNIAPGMTMEIRLVHKSVKKQEISVLLQSIFSENNNKFVWIVDSATNIVKKQKISVSNINEEGRVVVTAGLMGDETIVVAGVSKLQDGQKIKVLK